MKGRSGNEAGRERGIHVFSCHVESSGCLECADGAGWSGKRQTRLWCWVPGSTEGKDASTLSLLRAYKKDLADGFTKQMFGVKVGGRGMAMFEVEGISGAKAWCHRGTDTWTGQVMEASRALALGHG